MLDRLRQILTEAKAKRMLKRASSIISKLDYEIADFDQPGLTLAFKLKEESLALFVADASTLGSRIEATIVMPAALANLKLLSDLAMIACNNRCSITGLSNCGRQLAKVELIYCLGQRWGKADVDLGISYLCQALNGMSEVLVKKLGVTKNVKFDLSMFDDEDVPFFDPGLIGERKVFMYGDDWGTYVAEAANQNALGGYTAVEIDHDMAVVCAARDFEQINECSLAEVGGLVMMELARHRNNQATEQSKEDVN